MDAKTSSNGEIKLGDTARIDRRNTILAQIEAALLANKLELEDTRVKKVAGSNPYDSGPTKRVEDTWRGKRPR